MPKNIEDFEPPVDFCSDEAFEENMEGKQSLFPAEVEANIGNAVTAACVDEEAEDPAEELTRLAELVNIDIGRKDKRPMCLACSRPLPVCWCLPPYACAALRRVRCSVVLLQHPHEEKRCLRTAPMLETVLPRCRVVKGKKFTVATVPEMCSPDALLLFPGPDAVSVSSLPGVGKTSGTQEEARRPYTLLLLDGTWHQARAMLHNTPDLRAVKKVIVRSSAVSQYVIRTQPSDAALSTVESAALALAALEDDPGIYDTLLRPLATLCRHQLSHGAVVHHSKESRYRVAAQDQAMGKRTAKTLQQCGAYVRTAGTDGRHTCVADADADAWRGQSTAVDEVPVILNKDQDGCQMELMNQHNNAECKQNRWLQSSMRKS